MAVSVHVAVTSLLAPLARGETNRPVTDPGWSIGASLDITLIKHI